jgi:hypothetical protein
MRRLLVPWPEIGLEQIEREAEIVAEAIRESHNED